MKYNYKKLSVEKRVVLNCVSVLYLFHKQCNCEKMLCKVVFIVVSAKDDVIKWIIEEFY